MSAPVIAGITQGIQATDATVWTLTYPDNLREGELVLVFIGCDADPASMSASGFVTSIDMGAGLAKRIVPSGGLVGDFTVTLSQAEQGCWKVLRIQGWEGTLGSNFINSDPNGGSVPAAGYVDTTGTVPDPGAISPFNWDSSVEETLVIGHVVADHGDTVFTDNPVDAAVVGANQSSGGPNGAAMSVAFTQLTAEPLDMSAWTTLDTSRVFRAYSIAVRPGSSGPPVQAPIAMTFPHRVAG